MPLYVICSLSQAIFALQDQQLRIIGILMTKLSVKAEIVLKSQAMNDAISICQIPSTHVISTFCLHSEIFLKENRKYG